MSDSQLAHLVKMINQIGENNVYQGNEAEAASKLASHIQRFWARSMKAEILRYAEADGKGLSSVAKRALRELG